jgi:hypothetical protein
VSDVVRFRGESNLGQWYAKSPVSESSANIKSNNAINNEFGLGIFYFKQHPSTTAAVRVQGACAIQELSWFANE